MSGLSEGAPQNHGYAVPRILRVAKNVPEEHRGHRWSSLFVERREQWGQSIQAFIFGHGLYQQCLVPRRGLTGKAIYIATRPRFFAQCKSAQYGQLDELLAQRIAGQLQTPRELLPLPLLGVPGWWPVNIDPHYYADEWYFRSQKRA